MKTAFSILVCFLSALVLRGQIPVSPETKNERPFDETSGLTAYYFWQEGEDGAIDSGKINQPYLQNFVINLHVNHYYNVLWEQERLITMTNKLAHNPKWSPENCYPFYRLFHARERRVISKLRSQNSTKVGSVVFRSNNGEWESAEQQSVLYFTVDANKTIRFSHSSDSLIAPDLSLACASNGHYKILRYLSADGQVDSSNVFTYNGKNITQSIRQQTANESVRLLLLINGYRGPKTNNDPGDGLLTQKDRFYYWFKIDNRFQELLNPAMTYYADGSFPISTSNHRNRLRFGISWLRTKLTPKKQASKRVYKRLTEKPNPTGFDERKQAGKLAGQVFLQAHAQFPFSPQVKDTLDIVSHSMGYAYSLGFLEVVEPYVVLRTAYIVAPENAGQGTYDWSKFAHVWQYGSNLGEPNADPLREQDGIAPQVAVKGIENLSPEKGGRIFLPDDWPHKNFVDSHMIYSFDWIFDRIGKGQPGYVGN